MTPFSKYTTRGGNAVRNSYNIYMPFIFIDYTGLYFTAVAKTPVPAMTSGKFVRIRNGTTDYVIFSPREFTKYHANIVERFCLDKGIEGSYDREGKRYDILDRSWVILGGGKFEKDESGKTLRLSDNSLAYGKFEKQNLREAFSALPEFTGFTVLIE
jgi:hypothetical protein